MTDLVGLTKTLQSGRTLLGTGWKTVETFDDIDDEEYEEDEEEYVVMDLGTAMDGRTLQTEAAYQLIGMDTSMPFLKVGEHVFQGKVTGLIGDEVLFEVIRGEEDAQDVHYNPIHTTRKRIEFRGITLAPRPTYRGPAADPVPLVEAPVAAATPMDVDDEAEAEAPVASVKSETPAAAEAHPQPVAGPSTRGSGRGRGTGRRGRPVGVPARPTIEVRTLADVADIHHAGGLGELRLTIAKDATKELIDAVSEARGNKPFTPGQRLSRAQEDRLIGRLPGTGVGSRGGKAARGGRIGAPVPGRKRGPKGGPGVDSSGVGMADDFIGGGVGAGTGGEISGGGAADHGADDGADDGGMDEDDGEEETADGAEDGDADNNAEDE